MTGTQRIFVEDSSIWEVRFVQFPVDAPVELVNEALAERPGWEPFATQLIDSGGWMLLLRRQM